MRCKCPGDVLAFFKNVFHFYYFFFIYIFLQHVQVGPAISHASLTPGRQGERMDKQITDHQEEAE